MDFHMKYGGFLVPMFPEKPIHSLYLHSFQDVKSEKSPTASTSLQHNKASKPQVLLGSAWIAGSIPKFTGL